MKHPIPHHHQRSCRILKYQLLDINMKEQNHRLIVIKYRRFCKLLTRHNNLFILKTMLTKEQIFNSAVILKTKYGTIQQPVIVFKSKQYYIN